MLLRSRKAFYPFIFIFSFFIYICLSAYVCSKYTKAIKYAHLPSLVADGAACSWHLWSTDSVLAPPPCRCNAHQRPGPSCKPASPPLVQQSASTVNVHLSQTNELLYEFWFEVYYVNSVILYFYQTVAGQQYGIGNQILLRVEADWITTPPSPSPPPPSLPSTHPPLLFEVK